MRHTELKVALCFLAAFLVIMNTISVFAFFSHKTPAVPLLAEMAESAVVVSSVLLDAPITALSTLITARDAKIIALDRVDGRVTAIDGDQYNGRDVWEVEVERNNDEADVLVDMETGKILHVEWEDSHDSDNDDDHEEDDDEDDD